MKNLHSDIGKSSQTLRGVLEFTICDDLLINCEVEGLINKPIMKNRQRT
jgi:hypothetical protein